jgi:hypothetical protein
MLRSHFASNWWIQNIGVWHAALLLTRQRRDTTEVPLRMPRGWAWSAFEATTGARPKSVASRAVARIPSHPTFGARRRTCAFWLSGKSDGLLEPPGDAKRRASAPMLASVTPIRLAGARGSRSGRRVPRPSRFYPEHRDNSVRLQVALGLHRSRLRAQLIVDMCITQFVESRVLSKGAFDPCAGALRNC